jgi:hypothetical protein
MMAVWDDEVDAEDGVDEGGAEGEPVVPSSIFIYQDIQYKDHEYTESRVPS